MRFGKFIWNNYKESKRGEQLIRYFSDFRKNIETGKSIDVYKDIIRKMSYNNTEITNDDLARHFQGIIECKNSLIPTFGKVGTGTYSSGFARNIDEFESFAAALILTRTDGKGNSAYVFDVFDIPFLSELFYYIEPEYCFPYYFDNMYYWLEAIFNEFGIFAPPVPKKGDREGRMLHYPGLCRSLYEFRIKFDMNEYELPAFLYGFAVEIVRRYTISDELPRPRKAFFVGWGQNEMDFVYLDDVADTDISSSQGNTETQPGDIIVMYCLGPRSYIHSIWRAATPGFSDPFFLYYKTVYIAKPIRVTPISIGDMRKDEVLAQMPLLKANMQGINGRLIEKVYYDRIIELIAKKGDATERLPRLPDEQVFDVSLKTERDVEKNLLEPLLKRLGYQETDWKRQLTLRMGRGEKVYPDYVIFPKEERNNESGYWIWEAKHTIIGNKQLKEDFGQAKSYALRLNCKGLGLVSKEGIWLSEASFEFEKVKYWTWKQIQEADCFNDIFNICGNRIKL
ncbi:MAG: type I restriction enzyme HsdR N-terminal domain-containing protein [Oscillospiraceae bacterium]|jgi:hypothetical protein|nr:type I restriction enzyme HsdR N-terminal domain-containing protein [Oscillospiraceae bacterium]